MWETGFIRTVALSLNSNQASSTSASVVETEDEDRELFEQQNLERRQAKRSQSFLEEIHPDLIVRVFLKTGPPILVLFILVSTNLSHITITTNEILWAMEVVQRGGHDILFYTRRHPIVATLLD